MIHRVNGHLNVQGLQQNLVGLVKKRQGCSEEYYRLKTGRKTGREGAVITHLQSQLYRYNEEVRKLQELLVELGNVKFLDTHRWVRLGQYDYVHLQSLENEDAHLVRYVHARTGKTPKGCVCANTPFGKCLGGLFEGDILGCAEGERTGFFQIQEIFRDISDIPRDLLTLLED